MWCAPLSGALSYTAFSCCALLGNVSGLRAGKTILKGWFKRTTRKVNGAFNRSPYATVMRRLSMRNNEKWMELCRLASGEQDPKKLAELIEEANDLIDAKQVRLFGENTPCQLGKLNSVAVGLASCDDCNYIRAFPRVSARFGSGAV
jgi:hypothetical protein